MRLQNKVAIVTGGGSGIGRAISSEFCRQGASTAVVDIDLEAADRVVLEISERHGSAVSVQADVTDAGQVDNMVASVISRFGRVDVLVNNAGTRCIKPFLDYTVEDWRWALESNLTAHFLCSKAVVPRMLENGKGKIINIVSVAAMVGRANRVGYCAAKGGLLSFTKALAVDMAGKNICVNAIAPGTIETPRNAGDTRGPDFDWGKTNLVGRGGDPRDVAQAAVFLASDESDFVTGSDIKVDGGVLAGRSGRASSVKARK